MVIKSEDGKLTSSTLDLALSKFIAYGREEILNYLNNAKQEIEEGVGENTIDIVVYNAFIPKHKELVTAILS